MFKVVKERKTVQRYVWEDEPIDYNDVCPSFNGNAKPVYFAFVVMFGSTFIWAGLVLGIL